MPRLTQQELTTIHTEIAKYRSKKQGELGKDYLKFFVDQFEADLHRSTATFTNEEGITYPIPDLSSEGMQQLKMSLATHALINGHSYPCLPDIIQFVSQEIMSYPYSELQQHIMPVFTLHGLMINPLMDRVEYNIQILSNGRIHLSHKIPIMEMQVIGDPQFSDLFQQSKISFTAAAETSFMQIDLEIDCDGRYSVTDVFLPSLTDYQVIRPDVAPLGLLEFAASYGQARQLEEQAAEDLLREKRESAYYQQKSEEFEIDFKRDIKFPISDRIAARLEQEYNDSTYTAIIGAALSRASAMVQSPVLSAAGFIYGRLPSIIVGGRQNAVINASEGSYSVTTQEIRLDNTDIESNDNSNDDSNDEWTLVSTGSSPTRPQV